MSSMADHEQLTHKGIGESLAGDIRAGPLEVNGNEADQQLTLKRTLEGPILDIRLPVPES